MKTSEFDYELPPEIIAQFPVEPRDAARLMVLDREKGGIKHKVFHQLTMDLHPGDLLVLNRTRVIPARLYGSKIPTGGRIEILLLRREAELTWEAIVGGKGMKPGRRFRISPRSSYQGALEGEVLEMLDGPRRLIRFNEDLTGILNEVGHVPLPPYIHREVKDFERYQTVYAQEAGSAAAPTAGLHFTPKLLEKFREIGVGISYVTLHIGLDTFAPVQVQDPKDHHIHTEWCQLSKETADAVNQVRLAGGRVICVGTTTVRTLETAARKVSRGGFVSPFEGATDLYILPGFHFRVVDAMITNFHLPKSTLLMMVSAFTGREEMLRAYRVAKRAGYRFFSFGDAMFIR